MALNEKYLMSDLSLPFTNSNELKRNYSEFSAHIYKKNIELTI